MTERTLEEKQAAWAGEGADKRRLRNMKDAREDYGQLVVCAWCGMSEPDDPDMHDSLCPAPELMKKDEEWAQGVLDRARSEADDAD